MTNDETFAGEPLDPHGSKDATAHLRAEVERLTQDLDKERDRLAETISGLLREHERADVAAQECDKLRALAERLTRERDEAIGNCKHALHQVGLFQARAEAAERQVATLRELAEEINNALDAFWNDPERPPLHQMRSETTSRICIIQEKFRDALRAAPEKEID